MVLIRQTNRTFRKSANNNHAINAIAHHTRLKNMQRLIKERRSLNTYMILFSRQKFDPQHPIAFQIYFDCGIDGKMMGMVTKITQRHSVSTIMSSNIRLRHDFHACLGEAAAGNVEQELLYAHHSTPDTMRRTGH